MLWATEHFYHGLLFEPYAAKPPPRIMFPEVYKICHCSDYLFLAKVDLMNIRHPLRAGSFYEASPSSCRHHAEKLIETAEIPGDLPEKLVGGIVPHAGWLYSGRLAAKTLKTLCQGGKIDTFVLLGADHTGMVQQGEVYDSGTWQTPLGEVAVDESLASAILSAGGPFRSNPEAHTEEHSIEVQVPLIQVLAPSAKILPIAVPPTDLAVQIGRRIGKVLTEYAGKAVVVGSTDLTHHGGRFPAPGGRGETGMHWTVKNDARMLDLIEAMNAEGVVPEAEVHHNACGAGAAAAAIAACREIGATEGICLEYTNSYQVTHALYPQEPDDTTVGYASVVFA